MSLLRDSLRRWIYVLTILSSRETRELRKRLSILKSELSNARLFLEINERNLFGSTFLRTDDREVLVA